MVDDRVIQDHVLPRDWRPAGYACLVERHGLQAPLHRVTAVSLGNISGNRRTEGAVTVHGKRDWPGDSDAAHLEFAISREPLDLLLMKKAFQAIDPKKLAQYVSERPQAIASRKLWFLYEWLIGKELDVKDLASGNYVDVLDPARYYARSAGPISRRHRVRDNLPGTPAFCALARRTEMPDAALKLAARAHSIVDAADRSAVRRAAAYLLLADSQSTFEIEGERPPRDRLERWGRTLGLAGKRELSVEMLTELQTQLIGDERFIEPGLRGDGVFLGRRDNYGDPRPEFIGARPEDVPSLVDGMIAYDRMLRDDPSFNPLAHAAGLSFGFVYVHPFTDGNGRLHRYLINHVLGERHFSPDGVVLPVSTVIQDRMDDYISTLQGHSGPLMPFIPWKAAAHNNVEVTADTADLYRFIDTTQESTFLAQCVALTIDNKLPSELRYIEAHDRAERRISSVVDMPSPMVSDIIVQIMQNSGNLSKRRRKRDYAKLTDEETASIEALVREEFGIEARAEPKNEVEPEFLPPAPRFR